MGSLKIALTPGKLEPGALPMPMLTSDALLARLSGDELKPRMQGTGGIQFIIGSTQGVSSHTSYSGQAPVAAPSVPGTTAQPPVDRNELQKRASDALGNLIRADMPASGQAPTPNAQ